jgi:putative spermidine/putrescine transport system substrate-binding protein
MNTKLKYTSVVAAAAVAGILTATPALAQEAITAVSWGGAYGKSQIEAYYKPYTAKTGVTINSEDYNGGLAQVRAMVEADNVTWNVVDFELSDIVRGCDEGLLEVIDLDSLPPAPDGTPAKDDFLEGTLHECGVGEIVWSTVFAYDASKFSGDKPSSIADLFDTEKFPGKRGLRKTPRVNLEWALMADGVPVDEVYDVLSTDEGVDRAFAMLDKIKDSVIWWEAGAQPPQMLADGEVKMASAYNGRLFNAIFKENKPFEIIWDGQVWDIDLWGIPKGAKNLEQTLDFVRYSTDTQRLADQTKWISYGPVRKSSLPLVAPEMQPHMPTYAENFKNALQNDFEWWADHQDEMNERFAAWLAQ